MPRILFYYFKNVHIPILTPILNEALSDERFEVGYCTPTNDYVREVRAGFRPGETAFLPAHPRLTRVNSPREFRPDITFIADSVTHLVQDAGKIVNVGHGLLSKGQYFTDTEFIHRENLEHLLLVPGTYHYDQIRASNRVFIPLAPVGYAKMDALFRPDAPTRDELFRKAKLDPSKKAILYAPTFNIALSAIPILWTRIRKLATEDRYLLIKLHGSTLPEMVDHHQTLAENHPNIKLITDPDITSYLQLADVMLSDVSSAWMEYILLDKPVVLFNNPNQSEYANYDPRDIEYAWRDVGLQVSNMEETEVAIDRSLDNPGELSHKRHEVIDRLGIPLDGQASRRALETALELFDGSCSKRCAVDLGRVGVIIPNVEDETGTQEIVDALDATCGEKLIIWGIAQGARPVELSRGLRDRITLIDPESLPKLMDEVDYVCLVPGVVRGDDRWLFRLINHLRRNSELNAIVPITPQGAPCQAPMILLQEPRYFTFNMIQLDRDLKSTLVARNIDLSVRPRGDFGVLRSTPECAEKLLNWLTDGVQNPFVGAVLALDVVVEIPPISYPLPVEDIEEYISTLAKRAAHDAVEEDDGARAKRLKAEDCLKLARWKQSTGDLAGAEKWARGALAERPDCYSASNLLAEIASKTTGISNR